ncbi:RagB/SusD family nutrient uptake outer membrane protein [Flaviaesturariibacter amylovorans]|uniref:RagB/SusD family nutrient uptake outer membrane protein n=1 Tax=Flaviaesturariibacter amylovorans TaxID=1084520 RepID=A0ABP8H6Y2_9BACT
MKKIFLFATTAFLIAVGSCKKLELPPTFELASSEINKSTSNLDGLINGAYGRWIAQGAGNLQFASGFDHILFAEAMASGRTTFPSPQSSAAAVTNLAYNFSLLEDNAALGRLSRNLYASIAMANSVLYYAQYDPPQDADFPIQKGRLLGEAYFIRALCFFQAVRYWGHQYGHNSNAAGGGIMLALDISRDGTVGVGRSSVEDAYRRILNDLDSATLLLPANYDPVQHAAYPAYRFRASKAAAIALQAKVNFQQATPASYQKAKELINRVLGPTPGAIASTPETGGRTFALQTDVKVPFNAVGFQAPPANSEEILRLVNNTSATQGYTTASQNLTSESGGNPFNRGQARWFLARPTPNPPAGSPVNTSPLFDDPLNDRRFTELTANFSFTGGVGNQRFSQKWGLQTQQTLIGMQSLPLLRAADLVIMRAEINAVQGNLADALADYNLIRRRAITGYADRTLAHPAIGGTQAGLIAEIVQERRRELLFEGDEFWSWKRMAAYNAQNGPVYPAAEVAPLIRGTQTFAWNANRILLKIALDDLTLNPQLGTGAQNPG